MILYSINIKYTQHVIYGVGCLVCVFFPNSWRHEKFIRMGYFEFSFLLFNSRFFSHSCNFIRYLPIKYLPKHILLLFTFNIIIATWRSQAGASLSLLWIVPGCTRTCVHVYVSVCRKHFTYWYIFLRAFWQFTFSSSSSVAEWANCWF